MTIKMDTGFNISVIIPSYRRPNDLRRCLFALTQQTLTPHEVIVVARADDEGTWAVISSFEDKLPIHGKMVHEPGLIHAENVGIKAALGNIIAFTDDDAAPHPDWLEKISRLFQKAEPNVVGVGGRDIIHIDGEPHIKRKSIVGKITWFGRLQGNHEHGFGRARYVDTLKGVNMAYRSHFLKNVGLDTRLLGRGAQMHSELMLGAQAKRMGFRQVYDPTITVDHFPGIRFGRDQRASTDINSIYENVYNETLAILTHLTRPQKIFAFMLWAFAIGHRGAPGVAQVFRLKLYGYPSVTMFIACQKGRLAGIRSYRNATH